VNHDEAAHNEKQHHAHRTRCTEQQIAHPGAIRADEAAAVIKHDHQGGDAAKRLDEAERVARLLSAGVGHRVV
jgi:hypothetical protein